MQADQQGVSHGDTGDRLGGVLSAALGCFLLSGLAGLIYEVAWTRMLTQIFGNTTHAIATVLAAFMAGLALGSYLFGRLTDRWGNVLMVYALLEVGVGVYGLLVPWLFQLTYVAYLPLARLLELGGTAHTLVLFLLSFLLLLLPTFLMGATMPVLSRFFVRHLSQLGRRVGHLYAVNTLGAVLGCAAAGYLMIPALGLAATVRTAALINFLVAAIALPLAAWQRFVKVTPFVAAPWPVPAHQPVEPPAAPLSTLGSGAVLIAFGLSGFTAMVYENAWVRALTLVIGTSTYSFTTMLTTFLVGLSVGGASFARWGGKRSWRVGGLGYLEVAIGLAALATIPLFQQLPFLFLRLQPGFADSFPLFLLLQVILSALVMLPPTILLGMTFPLVARLFTKGLARVGSGVGTSYFSNTLGAIAGAFAGGFLLIPSIGVQHSLYAAVAINLATGLGLIFLDLRPRRALEVTAVGGVALASVGLFFWLPSWDRQMLTSAVSVYSDSFRELGRRSLQRELMHRDELLYYHEGLTATISVHRITKDYLYLKTNGKIDASHGDELTQLLVAYLPILFQPQARQVLVIGLGSGMTLKAVATLPAQGLEVAEIEPAMVSAARYFGPWNGRVLDDPRVKIILADARNYMLVTPRTYDLIISQPSNPWIAGVASLYTREFYEAAKRQLSPGGIFAQWFQAYSMSPDDLRMVFRTLVDSFPHLSLWAVGTSDFLLVGSRQEQRLHYPALQRVVAGNRVMGDDLRRLGFDDPFALIAMYRMGRKELDEFSRGASHNTDDRTYLEFSAPRNLLRATTLLNHRAIARFSVSPKVEGLERSVKGAARLNYYLSRGYKASAREDKALLASNKAIQQDPENVGYHLWRAQLLVEMKRLQEAAEESRWVLERDRSKLPQIAELAKRLAPGEAAAIFRRIIATGDGTLTREGLPAGRVLSSRQVALISLGDIALEDKDLEEAQDWYQQARKEQPAKGKLNLAFGRLALAKKDYRQALVELEEARAAGDDSPLLYGTLAEAYRGLNRCREAETPFRRALRHKMESAEWRLGLGECLVRLGRTREAEVAFREVLAQSPSNSDAWEALLRLGRSY